MKQNCDACCENLTEECFIVEDDEGWIEYSYVCKECQEILQGNGDKLTKVSEAKFKKLKAKAEKKLKKELRKILERDTENAIRKGLDEGLNREWFLRVMDEIMVEGVMAA